LVGLVNRGEADGKTVLASICDNFKTKLASVQFLARGKCESEQLFHRHC
jgi:ADP-ribosylglycohydrolase